MAHEPRQQDSDDVEAIEQRLTDQLRTLGPDHPDTLATRANLAFWLGQAGDVVAAVEIFEQLLTDRLRLSGPDHPDTLITRNGLAMSRNKAGDAAGAVEAFEQLLADQIRVLGPDHHDTGFTRSNLAFWRGDPGDVVGAFERLLADQVREQGPDHPATLTTRSNLALWRARAGDVAGAVDAFEQLLADQLRVLGPDHSATLATRGNLALWRGEAGEVDGSALPGGLDLTTPSTARVYDAYLGGHHNNRADRDFADRVRSMFPNSVLNAGENRKALLRGVRWAVGQGPPQVIDLGAGVPTRGSIHEAARGVDPAARVVYVDYEAVAYHAIQDSIAGDPRLGVVRADVRDVDAVLGHEVTTGLLDLAQPVVLVMGALLHFVSGEPDPAEALLAAYRDAVAPGSFLVLTHGTSEVGQEDDMRNLARMYRDDLGIQVTYRSHDDIARILAGYTLMAPGIVPVPLLLPDSDDHFDGDPWQSLMYAAVART
jgi:hypothetical protein